MNSTPIVTPEINGKWKQLCRLLISYNDFKHASDIAHFYLEGDYVVDRNEWGGKDYFQKRVIGEALNSGMIISYARPFSGNDKSSESKVPDLPRRYLRLLSEENKKVHDDLMEARNISVAHSDSEAWKMMPGIIPLTNGRRMVAPVHNDTRAPLSNGDINALVSNCRIFMDAIIDERKRLELELHDFMPEIGVYEDENG